jgi:hypothetical protein
MKAKITLLIDVEPIEDAAVLTGTTRVLWSIHEAIYNAITHAEGEGFAHAMENEIALSVQIGAAMETESYRPTANANADIVLVCKQARASIRQLANDAGDVDAWNEGGHAYEASHALNRIIEENQ